MDRSHGDRPKIASQSVVHIEVARDRQGENHFLQILVSVAGREEMHTRTWLVGPGPIDDGVVMDLSASCMALVQDAIYTSWGAQQRLEGVN